MVDTGSFLTRVQAWKRTSQVDLENRLIRTIGHQNLLRALRFLPSIFQGLSTDLASPRQIQLLLLQNQRKAKKRRRKERKKAKLIQMLQRDFLTGASKRKLR